MLLERNDIRGVDLAGFAPGSARRRSKFNLVAAQQCRADVVAMSCGVVDLRHTNTQFMTLVTWLSNE